MNRFNSLYSNNATQKIALYTSHTELSIRDELIKTLSGNYPEVPKKELGILRRMRRDSDRKLIPCTCISSATHEPDKDHPCFACLSEGHLWDEIFIYSYNFDPAGISSGTGTTQAELQIVAGNILIPNRIFYLDYQEDLTTDDRMVELVLDKEGKPVRPYRRLAIWRIGSITPHRLDNGRLEFWKVGCIEEKTLPLALRK
jgi:hypothetical protein